MQGTKFDIGYLILLFSTLYFVTGFLSYPKACLSFPLDWVANEPPGLGWPGLALALKGSIIHAYDHHAQLSSWALGIQTEVIRLTQQELIN